MHLSSLPVAVAAILVASLLLWLGAQVRRAWLRHKPAAVEVQHLRHAPSELKLSGKLPEIAADVQHIVRAPWALALPGDLPNVKVFEKTRPDDTAVHQWLRDRGAVDFRETKVGLFLRNRTDELMSVRNIRVEVTRGEPLSGTYVYCPTAGANAATLLVFELDDEAPVAWEWQESGGRRRTGVAPYFDHHYDTIEARGVHQFVIVGRAERCLARWRLVIDLEIGKHDDPVHVHVGDGDPEKHFETTGDPVQGFATRLHWAWYAGGHFRPEPENR